MIALLRLRDERDRKLKLFTDHCEQLIEAIRRQAEHCLHCAQQCVRRAINHEQILNAVVGLDAVAMVNEFVITERAPKMLRHHVSVLQCVFALDAVRSVTGWHQTSGSIRGPFQGQGVAVFLPATIVHVAHAFASYAYVLAFGHDTPATALYKSLNVLSSYACCTASAQVSASPCATFRRAQFHDGYSALRSV